MYYNSIYRELLYDYYDNYYSTSMNEMHFYFYIPDKEYS